ncbi:MAG: DUF5050 domain-containing protein [Lachnospiraceae bacterium]|nr:DUF5050 domain-containing protein [Lachnospiraceae bacterium]
MRKRSIFAIVIAGMVLTGCGEKEEKTDTQDGTAQIAAAGKQTEKEEEKAPEKPQSGKELTLEEYVEQFPLWEYNWCEPEIAKQPWINSNLVNEGYICETEEGMIYYNLPGDTGLYYGKPDGTERVKVAEVEASNLQWKEDGLYYLDETNCFLYRFHPEEQYADLIVDKMIGEYHIVEDIVYYRAMDGIYSYNMADGSEEVIMSDSRYVPVAMTANDQILIYLLADADDDTVLKKGHLFAYSFLNKKVGYITKGVWDAVLIGTKVFHVENQARTLKSMDLAAPWTWFYTEATTDISMTEYADLSAKYYVNMKWRIDSVEMFEGATSIQPIFRPETLGNVTIEYLYQTTEKLYMYLSDGSVYYYEKATGDVGVFK